MVKSGSRDRQESLIIEHNSSFWKRLLSILLTAIVWLYGLIVFLLFFTAIFHLKWITVDRIKLLLHINDSSLQMFFTLGVILWFIFFITLWIWRFYNKHRFGPLTRRKYPSPATDEEICALGLISEKDYKLLKNGQTVSFESNPICSIYGEDR